jgi:predicted N-acyltransferase
MHSVHWLSHQGLSNAVARYLERESSGMAVYLDELNERSPYARMGLAPDDEGPVSGVVP